MYNVVVPCENAEFLYSLSKPWIRLQALENTKIESFPGLTYCDIQGTVQEPLREGVPPFGHKRRSENGGRRGGVYLNFLELILRRWKRYDMHHRA